MITRERVCGVIDPKRCLKEVNNGENPHSGKTACSQAHNEKILLYGKWTRGFRRVNELVA